MAVTQSLGHHFCPWPLPCNSLTVSLCFIYSWRRCADESSISLNQKLRRTGPLLENISRYVLSAYYMPTFTFQFTVCNWIVTLAGLIIVFPLSYMWCKLKSGNCHTTVFITVLLKLILEKQTYFSLCFPFSSSFKTTSLLPTLTDRWVIVHIHSPAFIYYYRYILLVPLRPSFLFRANVIRHCIVAGNSPQRFWSILAR